MRIKISQEDIASVRFLLRWAAVAVAAGAGGSAVLAGFRYLVYHGQALLASTLLPMALIAAAGALVVGTLLYRLEPDAAGEGVPSYITFLNQYEVSDNLDPRKATGVAYNAHDLRKRKDSRPGRSNQCGALLIHSRQDR